MANGFLYWYEADWSDQRALRKVATLEAEGLMLDNPDGNRVIEVSSEWETMGEPVVTDRTTLLKKSALQDRDQYSFNYWLSKDVNVYYRIRRVNQHSVVSEFGLDGLTVAEQDVAIRAILVGIRDAVDIALGFIVDRAGGSAEVDWDAVVVHGSAQASILPDVLALSAARWQAHQELATMRTRKFGPLLVYDRSGILNSVWHRESD